jgi:hypothetical protein
MTLHSRAFGKSEGVFCIDAQITIGLLSRGGIVW